MSTHREELEAELASLRARIEVVSGELMKLTKRDNTKEYNALFKDGITLEKVMALDWERFGSGLNDKWYRKVSDWIDEQQGLNGEDPAPLRGVYRDGYNPETSQTSFKVMMDQNILLESQMGLKKVLPFVKPHEGVKSFQIFRHDCEEQGFWHLLVTGEGESHSFEVWDFYNLCSRRYSNNTAQPEAAFPDLMTALSYIRDKHPYQRVYGDEDGYDY